MQCPIQRTLVEKSLLSADEIEWINKYHDEVWEKISPLVKEDTRATEWLNKEVAHL
jgi:Xaa-Pro aminopeptidase